MAGGGRGAARDTVAAIELEVRRSILIVYAVLALALSLLLLSASLHRGPGEAWRWLTAYLVLGASAVRWPALAPLAGGVSAFLLGFVRTHQGGFNLDLGLSLVALSVGAWVLLRLGRDEARVTLDLPGLALLSLAAWSAISLAFAVGRLRAFRPAPGFDYHAYQLNAFGHSSDEALVRAAIGATAAFLSFGLFLYGRSRDLDRRALGLAVFAALLANGAALLVQRYDPGFLRPAGAIPPGRLNGVTSFCYALGDAALALYLLLPAWGARRGVGAARTAVSLVLLGHAAVASGSRTAVLGMLAAAALWAWVRLVRRSGARGVALSLGATLLLLGAGWALYRATPPDQVTPLGRLKAGVEEEGFVGHLVAQRLHVYPLAFRVMAEYPLSGIGAGLTPAEISKQRVLLAPDMKVLDYLLTSFAPNQFLTTGIELGPPALLALLVAFGGVGAALLGRGGAGAADWAVSLLVLAGALQLGPALYNSEALVFCWLVVGLAARAARAPGEEGEASPPRSAGFRATGAILAGVVAVGLAGHALALPALSVDRQWQRLRWRLGMGMLAREGEGRWSRPQATFSVDTPATAVSLRWHAGDAAFPDYRAEVSFYVDGALVERSVAASGRLRESVLPLPAVAGFKRISVRVEPPLAPAERGGTDERRLGIFVHSVTPVPSPR